MKSLLPFLFTITIAASSLIGCSKSAQTAKESFVATKTIAVAGAAPDTAEPVVINLKWLRGKKYHLQMENVQSWQPSVAGYPQGKTTLGLTHEYTVSVAHELADGGQELELEFTAQKVFYQIGEVSLINFDSAQPPPQDAANPVAPILRRLIGLRVHLIIDGRGKVRKIEGFNQLKAQLAGADPQMRSFIDQIWSENNLGEMCDFAAALQPETAVKVGDTWPVHIEMPDPVGLLVMDVKCAFSDWESQDGRPCARIEFQGSVSSKAVDGGRVVTKVMDGGTVSGKAWIDPHLGVLANSATEQHMSVSTTDHAKTTVTQFHMTVNFRLIKITDS